MSLILVAGFAFTAIASALAVLAVRYVAKRAGAMKSSLRSQDIHKKPTPEWGGIAIYAACAPVIAYFTWINPLLLGRGLSAKEIAGFLVAGLVLIIGGALDDKYDLSPTKQLLFSFSAIAIVIVAGIGAREITNPFGGTFNLAQWEWYHFILPRDLITAIWLFAMMYTTKVLDGIDGLVSGVTVIGALVITGLTLTAKWFQPNVGLMATIVAGAFAGFLIWNWNPAKIFLGTGGSICAGFMLGVIAVISGGKTTTALLVMGLPFLDVIWVIFRRMFIEKRLPWKADRTHLHHRLLDAGFSVRQAAAFYYAVAAIFGIAALVLQSKEKLAALGVLLVVMVGIGSYVVVRVKRKKALHSI
jgi:UDP-GlcNAc:undecaprenyl-phosphate/decaprenyl-phosphate GlcNAc-1-phosphate transferase